MVQWHSIVFQWTLRLYHLRNVSRLSLLFILRLFLEHSEIEHCYFWYQLVLIDMCIYIIYFTLFYFMLHRAPVDTSLVTGGVTLFKYQLLLLLLLLLLWSLSLLLLSFKLILLYVFRRVTHWTVSISAEEVWNNWKEEIKCMINATKTNWREGFLELQKHYHGRK